MATSESKQTDIHSGHTEREWQKKFFGMGAQCYYCKNPLTLKTATKDHRTPRCRGGSDQIRNIVPACLACNQEKGWKTEAEFIKVRRREFSTNSHPRPAINLNLETEPNGADELSLAQREEPSLKQLRWESEGGCPIGFRSAW